MVRTHSQGGRIHSSRIGLAFQHRLQRSQEEGKSGAQLIPPAAHAVVCPHWPAPKRMMHIQAPEPGKYALQLHHGLTAFAPPATAVPAVREAAGGGGAPPVRSMRARMASSRSSRSLASFSLAAISRCSRDRSSTACYTENSTHKLVRKKERAHVVSDADKRQGYMYMHMTTSVAPEKCLMIQHHGCSELHDIRAGTHIGHVCIKNSSLQLTGDSSLVMLCVCMSSLTCETQ